MQHATRLSSSSASRGHSEEVFEEDDDLLHSDSLSSPVFSPSWMQLAQQPLLPDRRCGKGSYRRDSASKQHLVFVPPPARGSPPPSVASPTTAAAAAARYRRNPQPVQQPQPQRRPETLRLRATAISENVSSGYTSGGSPPKQLLSLSPSFHSKSTPPRRRLSTTHHSLPQEKETLALRSPPLAKPIDNWCVYCYQVVCSLYEVRGLAPPRFDEGGEWSGHSMMRGAAYECHRLLDRYRNSQYA